jgi:hypothetical protein
MAILIDPAVAQQAVADANFTLSYVGARAYHCALSGARGHIGDAPHLRLAANWTGLCAAGGGFKRGAPGGTRTRAAMT